MNDARVSGPPMKSQLSRLESILPRAIREATEGISLLSSSVRQILPESYEAIEAHCYDAIRILTDSDPAFGHEDDRRGCLSCGGALTFGSPAEQIRTLSEAFPGHDFEDGGVHAVVLATELAVKRAFERAALDRVQLERFLDSSGGFHGYVEMALRAIACGDRCFNVAKYQAEHRYGADHRGPKPLEAQHAILQGLFPEARSYDGTVSADAPGSEGEFLVLPWWRLADRYGQATEMVFQRLATVSGGKFNHRDCHGSSLGELPEKSAFFRRLADRQAGHDLLRVRMQLGALRAGRSARRVNAVKAKGECPLGAYETAMILLTHVERLWKSRDLEMTASGDDAAGRTYIRRVPSFLASTEGCVKVVMRDTNNYSLGFGVSTAFADESVS